MSNSREAGKKGSPIVHSSGWVSDVVGVFAHCAYNEERNGIKIFGGMYGTRVMVIRVSDFVKRVPQVAKEQLPRELRGFKVFLMPWLSQVYYDDKRLHYELAKLPSRYGDSRLELGLHFESHDRRLNDSLLTGFDRHLFEVRDALGDDWYAEAWDRGWTKIYTTFEYSSMDDELLEHTAARLAEVIKVMHPIYALLLKNIR